MIKTFIKTHIVNYAVDKLIDSICDNLGLYPDMEIKIYNILGELGDIYVYADVGDYILEIRKSYFMVRNAYTTPRFKVIGKMSPMIEQHIKNEFMITMPYTIDNNKIAKNVLVYMLNESIYQTTTIGSVTSRMVPFSRLTEIINSTCNIDKI